MPSNDKPTDDNPRPRDTNSLPASDAPNNGDQEKKPGIWQKLQDRKADDHAERASRRQDFGVGE